MFLLSNSIIPHFTKKFIEQNFLVIQFPTKIVLMNFFIQCIPKLENQTYEPTVLRKFRSLKYALSP